MQGNYGEYAPGLQLEPFVECFWTHSGRVAAGSVLPDGCIDFVFSRATGLQLAGTMTRPLVTPAARERFWGVRFRPGMARCFVEDSAVDFTDKVLPLADVLGKRARTLEANMEDVERPEEMVSVLREALVPRTAASPVQSAIRSLALCAGHITVGEISRLAGLSERQLRRRCLEETGITPKQLARIARFRRACASIHCDSRRNWVDLALGYGYYDQAHLIRDFQQFSGCTPGEYARRHVT